MRNDGGQATIGTSRRIIPQINTECTSTVCHDGERAVPRWFAERVAVPEGIDLHPTRIGAWDVEATGDRISVAGKKLYAMWDGKECVKYASKGLRLTPKQIDAAAVGRRIVWSKDAPTYKMQGVQWIKREINREGELYDDESDTA